jgi:hypothetical protein
MQARARAVSPEFRDNEKFPTWAGPIGRANMENIKIVAVERRIEAVAVKSAIDVETFMTGWPT